jgi:antitoxin HicB
MLERKYTVIFEPDISGGYIARVPALPGCVTEGDTLEEASAMAKDAIEGYIECLIERGLAVPEEITKVKPVIRKLAVLV